jgi:hypothetical protein
VLHTVVVVLESLTRVERRIDIYELYLAAIPVRELREPRERPERVSAVPPDEQIVFSALEVVMHLSDGCDIVKETGSVTR